MDTSVEANSSQEFFFVIFLPCKSWENLLVICMLGKAPSSNIILHYMVLDACSSWIAGCENPVVVAYVLNCLFVLLIVEL